MLQHSLEHRKSSYNINLNIENQATTFTWINKIKLQHTLEYIKSSYNIQLNIEN